jgi:hypothetical protein
MEKKRHVNVNVNVNVKVNVNVNVNVKVILRDCESELKECGWIDEAF